MYFEIIRLCARAPPSPFEIEPHFKNRMEERYMSISSYYKEKKQFLAEQKKERTILLIYGCESEEVKKMHSEDYEAWKADRIYKIHNSTSAEELGEESLSLAWLSRNQSNEFSEDVGSFLDSIRNEILLTALMAFDPEDLALIEACWINGVSQTEYAACIGKKRCAVSRKLGRIKKKLAILLKG
jgi:UDP-N-acetylmuramoylalanine-D-glutamate ligase